MVRVQQACCRAEVSGQGEQSLGSGNRPEVYDVGTSFMLHSAIIVLLLASSQGT